MKLADIEIAEEELIRGVMMNMRRAPKGHQQIQRWALVRDTFAVGSHVACALCHQYGLNPDEVLR